ncbi:MFS general substrate transporter [Amylocystis lapponica]|nr:MFS general substrate transporter [Amylocystis lapponica]
MSVSELTSPDVIEKAEKGSYSEKVVAEDPDAEFGGTEAREKLERKLLLKLDMRMFILVIIYILNYVSVAARLRGFEADLGLKGQQFATLLSILYVGYIVMQVPSNMLLNYMGKPSIHLPICMIIWGVISCLTGDFVGALLTRFFLGFVEAAFFPGALFLISKWYKRSELGKRTAILYGGNIISNAFGSLIASGILDGMQGALGHEAWRWLFYIEGALTEIRLALRRMEEDAGVGDEFQTEDGGQVHGLWLALTDWRMWWLAVLMLSEVVALSFNAYFPTLSATLGFGGPHSDKTGERFWHMATSYFVGIIGFIISICTMNTAARYISLFLMAQSYAGLVVLYTWVSNTFPRPPSKRAVAVAFVNAFSQIGNVAGSYVWPSQWGPTYRNSYAICIATSGCAIVMGYILKLHLESLNRKLEKEEQEGGVKEKGFRFLV